MQQMLIALGIPRRQLYHDPNYDIKINSFWMRPLSKHLELLERAKKGWKKKMQQFHPDKPGGCNRKASELNAIWKRVELLFKRKGVTLL